MAVRTPEQIAASGSEEAIQQAALQAIALWIQPHHPSATTIYHIPNGGRRGGNAAEAKIQGAKMQAAGQKKGIPDLCLPVPRLGYAALYIEMKKPKSGKLSSEQRRRITELASYGNFVCILDDWLAVYWLVYAWYNSNRADFDRQYAQFPVCDGALIYDPSKYW